MYISRVIIQISSGNQEMEINDRKVKVKISLNLNVTCGLWTGYNKEKMILMKYVKRTKEYRNQTSH